MSGSSAISAEAGIQQPGCFQLKYYPTVLKYRMAYKTKIKKYVFNTALTFIVLALVLLSIEFIARYNKLGEGHYSGFIHKRGYYLRR